MIHIFGDSFGDNIIKGLNLVSPNSQWVNILKEKLQQNSKTYALGGSSLEFTFEQFYKNCDTFNKNDIIIIGYKEVGAYKAELLAFYIKILMIFINESNFQIDLIPINLLFIQLFSLVYLDFYFYKLKVRLFVWLDFFSKFATILVTYFLIWVMRSSNNDQLLAVFFALIISMNLMYFIWVSLIMLSGFLKRLSLLQIKFYRRFL